MNSPTRLPLSEHAMQIAERSFPEHAAKSGRKAYKATLKLTGGVVVKTNNGQLVERRADGTSIFIKKIPVDKRVKSGITLTRAK